MPRKHTTNKHDVELAENFQDGERLKFLKSSYYKVNYRQRQDLAEKQTSELSAS